MSPLVSVLMSIHNAEETIDESANSLLQQSYDNIEYVFINDGSTDETLTKLQAFEDDRIHIISHDNIGIARALNNGLKHCHGKYIARMDADDIARPDRIALQVDFMQSNEDIAACGGSINEFDTDGSDKLTVKPQQHQDLLFYSLHKAPISNPTAMIRRCFLIDNNIEYDPAYRYSQDVKMWSDILRVGKLANLPDVLLDYRKSSGQITTKHRQEQKNLAEKVRGDTYQFIKDNYENLEPVSAENLYLLHKYMAVKDFTESRVSKISKISKSSLNLSQKMLLVASAALRA